MNIDFKSALMLLALATLWGGSFVLAEIALSEVPPLTIVLHRVFWAVPVLLIVIRWQGIAIPKSARAWFCYLVMGALNNAIPFSLIFWGQATIGSGLASILNSTTAFFGALVAGVLLADEPLTSGKLVGAVCGVCGVAVIMGVEALTNFDLRSLAQLAILGAALSYAFAGAWGKRYLSEYSPIANAFGMLACSILLMIPAVFYADGLPTMSLSVGVWSALLALASLCTAIAYVLYFSILVRAGSANLMLVTLLIPPVAVGLSFTFLGQSIGRDAVLGFAFIAIGLIITDGRLAKWFRKPST